MTVSASRPGNPGKLTLWETLDAIRKVLCILATLPLRLIGGIFRGPRGAKKYWIHVGHGLMRTLTSTMTTRQNQLMGPSTNEAYEAFVKKNGLTPDTVELAHGGLGHWLGNKKAKNVLIYYHGGGFQLSAHAVYFTFLEGLIADLKKNGHDIAVFALTYTLTPHETYPIQLRQAVEALRYILAKTHFTPSDVFLGGDSAGGNLCLGILSHLSHPHPEIDALEIESDLAGVIAISPWVSFADHWPSITDNQYKDLVSREIGKKWGAAYLNGKAKDYYNEPVRAPTSWWEGAKVHGIIVLAGGDELPLSSIEAIAAVLKEAKDTTELFVAPDEGHVSAIVDRIIGVTAESEQEKAIKRWLRLQLETSKA